MMDVVKMDRRYDGHDRYTHRIEFRGYGPSNRVTTIKQWVKARNWLWTQFGPSGELFCARPEYFGEQPVWAWDSEKSSIYLKEEAYTLFMLKKEFWQNASNL